MNCCIIELVAFIKGLGLKVELFYLLSGNKLKFFSIFMLT